MTTVLAIDTASESYALAVSVDGESVRALEHRRPADQTRSLVEAIAHLLDGLPPLAGIVAVVGPGSFSGLRVGLASASALSMGRGVPAAGVSTFAAIARAAGPGRWLAMQPAGRSEFITCWCEDGAPSSETTIANADDLARQPIIGDGAGSLGGRELTPGQRIVAALEFGQEALASNTVAPLEAQYVREPNITTARRATRAPQFRSTNA